MELVFKGKTPSCLEASFLMLHKLPIIGIRISTCSVIKELIYDVYYIEVSENVKNFLEEKDCAMADVSNKMTYFKPLNLILNSTAKSFLK